MMKQILRIDHILSEGFTAIKAGHDLHAQVEKLKQWQKRKASR
jgi:hypothetical protein